jgi:hypothetical protein
MNKTIKKGLAFALGALFTVSLVSCSDAITVTGLENYPCGDDDFEINTFLIPENMLNEYPYLEGDFYYYLEDTWHLKDEATVSILYLRYSEEVYPEAKEYMLNNTDYTEEVHYTYNGYEFYENLFFPKFFNRLDENGKNIWPYNWFNMVSYNDQNNTLVFLGFYYGHFVDDVGELVQEQGWGAFLKKYFPYYDFDA